MNQPDQLNPVYLGSVNRWECDENDHLNVRFFAQKMQQTLQFGLIETGLATAESVADMCGNISSQHMRYLAEARIAVPITGYFAVLGKSNSCLRVLTELRNSGTNSTLATYVLEIDGDYSAASIMTIDEPDYAKPRGVDAVPFYLKDQTLDQLIDRGCSVIGKGVIQAEECDGSGFLQSYLYMGRNSDSMPNLFARFEDSERGDGFVGGAVLEYRMSFYSRLRRGDRFEIVSGVKDLHEKTQVFVHILFNSDTGEMITGSEALAISMDLVARKAIAIPADRRARMEQLLLS